MMARCKGQNTQLWLNVSCVHIYIQNNEMNNIKVPPVQMNRRVCRSKSQAGLLPMVGTEPHIIQKIALSVYPLC